MATHIAPYLRYFVLTTLAGLACAAADTKTLWQIGSRDCGNAEFALAPKGYSRFVDDGFFIVGVSDAKTAWPYVQPGPVDAWAGNKPHTFSIWFGVDHRALEGTCRLVLDTIDTYHHAPPTLRIEVNGQSFERKTPAGATDASIFGDPAA